MRSELPEPYLKLGVICEKALQEKDGVLSLIRIVDRFVITAQGVQVPEEMPPQILNLNIVMVWVGGLGNHEAQVKLIAPESKEIPSPTFPFFLDALERGHQIIIAFPFQVRQQGLYWMEFLLNGKPKGRFPFRVIYQRVQVPPKLPEA